MRMRLTKTSSYKARLRTSATHFLSTFAYPFSRRAGHNAWPISNQTIIPKVVEEIEGHKVRHEGSKLVFCAHDVNRPHRI